MRRGESPPYRPRDPLVATLALLGGRGMAEPSTSPLTVNCMWGGQAAGLFTLGCGAGRQPRALSDVWLEYVLPLAVCRDEAEARA